MEVRVLSGASGKAPLVGASFFLAATPSSHRTRLPAPAGAPPATATATPGLSTPGRASDWQRRADLRGARAANQRLGARASDGTIVVDRSRKSTGTGSTKSDPFRSVAIGAGPLRRPMESAGWSSRHGHGRSHERLRLRPQGVADLLCAAEARGRVGRLTRLSLDSRLTQSRPCQSAHSRSTSECQ